MQTNVAEMTADELSRAILIARGNEMEAHQRAQRESQAAHRVMFARNATEAAADLRKLESALATLNAPKVAAQVTPAKVRCPHYKAIRRMFAVAKSAGLDTSNKKGMRAAFSALLGHTVTTRADLTAADYGRAIQNIENGLMWW
jgi:uncharacterized protein YfiM (DUF2279 family)